MRRIKKIRGFSLLEVIFTIAILAVAIFTLYSLFNLSLKMVWETKARVGATQLANQKLEIIRNLPYTSIGTVGGVVPGAIAEEESVELNSIAYDVYTNVVYVDDPFDGTWNSDPVDIVPSDYKRVLVRVSWNSNFSSSPVDFFTDVASRNGEEAIGGGTLAITVFDASGLPVGNANVHIYNNQISPIIDTNTFTNAQGQIVLPGIKAASDSYQITVTKSGYTTDKTYNTTTDLPSPDKPHLSIIEGRSTSESFTIDLVSNMNIHVQDVNGLALEGVTVSLRGEKTIGRDSGGDLVYKYNESKTTNFAGNIVLPNMEWDTYNMTVSEASGYDIAEVDPPQPIVLPVNSSQDVVITLDPAAEHSLLTVVKDIEGLPIAGASVHVTNSFGYDNTLETGLAGQAFFTPLNNATTTVEVTHGSYQYYLNEFILSGYTVEPVILVQ